MLKTKDIRVVVKSHTFQVGKCYKVTSGSPHGVNEHPEGICVAVRAKYPQGCLFNPRWSSHDGSCYYDCYVTDGALLSTHLGHYWYGTKEVELGEETRKEVLVDAGAEVVACGKAGICEAGKTVILGQTGDDGDILLFSPFWDAGHSGSDGPGVPGFHRSHWWVGRDTITLAGSKTQSKREMKS
jgi:hypothetical protein